MSDLDSACGSYQINSTELKSR